MTIKMEDRLINSPLISVVICSYNRAELLADVLQSVCEQTVDAAVYEVIIVDNNSADNTPQISQTFANRYTNIRYCVETAQGLSHARNRGWQEARGAYVAYVDDDCKVPEGWLAAAAAIIDQFRPTVFGGPYFAFFNTPKPYWYKPSYGSHEPFDSADFIDTLHDLHGGNLFVQRGKLVAVNGFDPDFGMTGNTLAYGEENELLERIRKQFPASTFYYDPALFVYHLVRPEKLSWRRLAEERFKSGRAGYHILHHNRSSQTTLQATLAIGKKGMRILYSVTGGLLLRPRQTFPHVQNYLYEETARQITALGWLYGQFEHKRGQAR